MASKNSKKNDSESVSKEQLIDQLFQGMDQVDAHFDATLKAMGLDPKGTRFKTETAHCIAMVRSWIDSGETDDYEVLSQLWEQRKDQVKADYQAGASAITTTEQNGITPHQRGANMLASPKVRQAYDAGTQLGAAAGAQVMDKAFWAGFDNGVGKLEISDVIPTGEDIDGMVTSAIASLSNSTEQSS